MLGSYQFQAAASSALITLRGVPLSNGGDLTSRLSDFPKLRHLHAVGGSPSLFFEDLPPSLRVSLVSLTERPVLHVSKLRTCMPPADCRAALCTPAALAAGIVVLSSSAVSAWGSLLAMIAELHCICLVSKHKPFITR